MSTDIITTSKLAIVHRARLQPKDAGNIAAGILMRPQRQQQAHWSRSQGDPRLPPMDGTLNCWTLCLLQHLDELGMEIALAPTPLSEAPPTTHNIEDHLADTTTDQRKQLTVIGLHHVEDLEAPEVRNWTPISYAQEKLQFT